MIMEYVLNWIHDNLERILILIEVLIPIFSGIAVVFNILNFSNDKIEYGLDDLEKQNKKIKLISLRESLLWSFMTFTIIFVFVRVFAYFGRLELLSLGIAILLFGIVTFASIYEKGRNITIILIVVLAIVITILCCIYKNSSMIFLIILELILLISYIKILPLIESSKRMSIKKVSNEKYQKNNSSRITFLIKVGAVCLYIGFALVLWVSYFSITVGDKDNNENTAKESSFDKAKLNTENIHDTRDKTDTNKSNLSKEEAYKNVVVIIFLISTIVFFIIILSINIRYYKNMHDISFIYFKHKGKKIYIYKKINDKFLCGNKDYMKWDRAEFDDRLKNIEDKIKKKYGTDTLKIYMDKLFLFSGYIRVDLGKGKEFFDKLDKYIENNNNVNVIVNDITSDKIDDLLEKIENIVYKVNNNKYKNSRQIKNDLSRLKKKTKAMNNKHNDVESLLKDMINSFEKMTTVVLVDENKIANVKIYQVMDDYQNYYFE